MLVMSVLESEWGSVWHAICLPSLVYNQLDYGIAFPIIPRITVQPLSLESIITFERNLLLH